MLCSGEVVLDVIYFLSNSETVAGGVFSTNGNERYITLIHSLCADIPPPPHSPPAYGVGRGQGSEKEGKCSESLRALLQFMFLVMCSTWSAGEWQDRAN